MGVKRTSHTLCQPFRSHCVRHTLNIARKCAHKRRSHYQQSGNVQMSADKLRTAEEAHGCGFYPRFRQWFASENVVYHAGDDTRVYEIYQRYQRGKYHADSKEHGTAFQLMPKQRRSAAESLVFGFFVIFHNRISLLVAFNNDLFTERKLSGNDKMLWNKRFQTGCRY